MNMILMTLEEAKRTYTNRYTMDYKPPWAMRAAPNGKYFAPQYASDKEWYENTLFPPNNPLSRTSCWSRDPTWPMGEWLSKPLIT